MNGDAVEQEVFAFMTTEPNELTASINHERRPVLTPPTSRPGSRDHQKKRSSSRAATPPTRCASCSRVQSGRICWRPDLKKRGTAIVANRSGASDQAAGGGPLRIRGRGRKWSKE